jgi:hypothetical protein
MRRLASYALVAAAALVAAGCGASRARVVVGGPPAHALLGAEVDPGNRVGPGPFVPSGGWIGGGGGGLLGDGGSGPRGSRLGCRPGRRYSYAFGVENRTKAPIRLTAVSSPNPAPRIVDRVATQLRLSPPQRPRSHTLNWGGDGIDLVYRRWSAKRAKAVTIPRHRTATVQINFLMHDCAALAHGRTVVVPGSLVLRYRTSGHSGHQLLTLPGNRIVVVAGPRKRSCTPVAGSGSLVAADVTCAFARHAAPLCRAMHNGGWLGCTVAGRFWECGRFAGPGYPLRETCYLPHRKSHWFSVVWAGHGLGIWGAIQNRRANLGWKRTDAWPTTRGTCEARPGLGLFFESSALRLRGKGSDARVRFAVPGLHGRGRSSARTVVEVTAGRGGSYLGTDGRLTITRATRRFISGTVYASLRHGAKRASLNGTWSCRVAH